MNVAAPNSVHPTQTRLPRKVAEIGEISTHLVEVVAVGCTNGRQILVLVFVVEVPLRCGLLALVVVCLDTCDAVVDSKLS